MEFNSLTVDGVQFIVNWLSSSDCPLMLFNSLSMDCHHQRLQRLMVNLNHQQGNNWWIHNSRNGEWLAYHHWQVTISGQYLLMVCWKALCSFPSWNNIANLLVNENHHSRRRNSSCLQSPLLRPGNISSDSNQSNRFFATDLFKVGLHSLVKLVYGQVDKQGWGFLG